MRNNNPINFTAVKRQAAPHIRRIAEHVAPGGIIFGQEYTVRNPRRKDSELGSFKINIRTGKWGDFATGDFGGDIISYVAYVSNYRQARAAQHILQIIGASYAGL